jgi:hypothetical protein
LVVSAAASVHRADLAAVTARPFGPPIHNDRSFATNLNRSVRKHRGENANHLVRYYRRRELFASAEGDAN